MQAFPIISSKLSPPTLSHTLRREHLLNYLDSVKTPLLWVSAPGGSGKTTLVADWLSARQNSNIWLRLESSDSSLGTFFHHLMLAVQQAFPNAELDLDSFTHVYAFDPISYANKFFRQLAHLTPNVRLQVVLDDYQELSKDSSIHGLLSKLIDSMPDSIAIIAISREAPPLEYTSLKSNCKCSLIDWSTIRFSFEETGKLLTLALNETATHEQIAAIYERTDGWVAGIRLVTSNFTHTNTKGSTTFTGFDINTGLQNDSFNFFANEIMLNLESPIRLFISKTAFLPFFTVEMAKIISGIPDCDRLLDWLVRSNLFIEVHTSENRTYNYHALFRKYLKSYFLDKFGASETHSIALTAANILAENGSPEEAIELYIELGEFVPAISLIKFESENLVSQGRVQQLSKWLDLLPDAEINHDPDLLFIHGKSLLISSTEKSCEILRKAITCFTDSNHLAKALQAFGCYLEALAISGKDYHLLEECLHQLDQLIQSPTPEIDVAAESIACTVLFATSFRTLNHPLQERWKIYAEAALENCSDPLSLLKNCNNMMIYYRFSGEDRKTYHLMEILEPVSQQIESIPLLRLQTQLIYAFHYGYVCSEGSKAEELCRTSIQEGTESGILLYEFWFRYILVLTLLRDNRFDDAQEQIKILTAQYTLLPPVRRADILTLSGLCALYSKEFDQAIHDLEKANRMYSEAGAIYPTHWSAIILSLSHLENDDSEACLHTLNNTCSSDWLGSAYLKYQALCVHAWLEFKAKDPDLYKLKEAFSLARERDFVFIPLVGKEIFSSLCNVALANKIEVGYTQKIIEEHGLISDDKSTLLTHIWPKKFHILTLQPFKIVKKGPASEQQIELTQKPLELLKAIIAHGGYNVPVDLICDTLWPDSDGDAAYKALKTTLYRLRKNLEDENFIITHNNTLSISKDCWIDAFSFWTAPEEINSHNIKAAKDLAAYYQAHFLNEHVGDTWTFLARNRVKQNYKLLLDKIACFLLDKKQESEALPYFEKALELDATEEDFYMGIMKCHCNAKRLDRVESTFQRYTEACKTLLMAEPSARVSDLYISCKEVLKSDYS